MSIFCFSEWFRFQGHYSVNEPVFSPCITYVGVRLFHIGRGLTDGFCCFFCHGCFNALLLCTGICSVFTSVFKAFWRDYSAECFMLISYIINMYTHLCINIWHGYSAGCFILISCFRCISLHLFSHYICSSFESNLRLAMFQEYIIFGYYAVSLVVLLVCFMMCLSTLIFGVKNGGGAYFIISDLGSVSHIPAGYCEYLCMADIRGNVIDSGI